jgi:endo-1,4-beta-xylanase
MAIAETSDLRARGHPLIWGRLALPAYVNAITDAGELRALMRTHIETVVGRYRGRMAQYDVVNEPINLFGNPNADGGFDANVFYRVLGPGYVREALEMAHAADPDARLFVNDFLTLGPGPKQELFFALIAELVAAGAPIHGVGFQGHITPPFGPNFRPTRAAMDATIARFAALGLEVEITEVDVTLRDRHPCRLAAQRQVYHDLLAACLAAPACRGVTTWGISDAFTWIEGLFGVDGAPLPFDEHFAPKPAYVGMRDAMLAACGPDCDLGCTIDPIPVPAPTGCCATAADCGGDACLVGAVCDASVCIEGAPVTCDDGDPCTTDRCDPVAGCVTEAVAGIAAVTCACERDPPEICGGEAIPDYVGRREAKACELVGRAADPSSPRTSHLLRRAAGRFRRAARKADKAVRRGDLTASCGAALAERFAEHAQRALDVP